MSIRTIPREPALATDRELGLVTGTIASLVR